MVAIVLPIWIHMTSTLRLVTEILLRFWCVYRPLSVQGIVQNCQSLITLLVFPHRHSIEEIGLLTE